jgi:hypothetical protein
MKEIQDRIIPVLGIRKPRAPAELTAQVSEPPPLPLDSLKSGTPELYLKEPIQASGIISPLGDTRARTISCKDKDRGRLSRSRDEEISARNDIFKEDFGGAKSLGRGPRRASTIKQPQKEDTDEYKYLVLQAFGYIY